MWKTPRMQRVKTTGVSQQELHYIGCVFTTPSGGLQEESMNYGANPNQGYMYRSGPSLPATDLRSAPSEVGLFLV